MTMLANSSLNRKRKPIAQELMGSLFVLPANNIVLYTFTSLTLVS